MEDNVNPLEKRTKIVKTACIIGGSIVLIIALFSMEHFLFSRKTSDVVKTDAPVKQEVIPKLDANDSYNLKMPVISSKKIKIAFIGDTSTSTETIKAFQMIRSEGGEALVSLGDFDHVENPAYWGNTMDAYLGTYFPVLAVAGNHDEAKWDIYGRIAKAKIAQLPKDACVAESKGDIGLNYDCTLGPVHIALVTPDINIAQAKLRNPVLVIRDAFKKELLDKTFLQQDDDAVVAVDESDAWRICGWHKTGDLIQLANMKETSKLDVYEECRRFGAFIFTGHDHVYARSKTVLDFPGMIVDSSTDEVKVVPGSTGVAIVGLGGMSTRKTYRQGDAWWSKTYTLETLTAETAGKGKNTAGAMFCTFEKGVDTAPCYFKTIDGVVRDEFVMRR